MTGDLSTLERDTITLPAPAKINLSLHVCGKRADGYHLLDSLVCFAGVGDFVTATRANDFSLSITGPFGNELTADDDNLVLKAARFLNGQGSGRNGAALALDKRLPVASGIGGGSSDAAAAIRACAILWNMDTTQLSRDAVARLGADVPVCLARKPTRMMGIGERLEDVPALPSAWLVLVNPMQPLSTKTVFAALGGRHSGDAPGLPPRFPDVRALAEYLKTCINDLAAPATEALPVIGDILTALTATPNCLLARLSGSGPTCFGLFPDAAAAKTAAAAVAEHRPDWWAVAAPLLSDADNIETLR